jgi:hypothetical protein
MEHKLDNVELIWHQILIVFFLKEYYCEYYYNKHIYHILIPKILCVFLTKLSNF